MNNFLPFIWTLDHYTRCRILIFASDSSFPCDNLTNTFSKLCKVCFLLCSVTKNCVYFYSMANLYIDLFKYCSVQQFIFFQEFQSCWWLSCIQFCHCLSLLLSNVVLVSTDQALEPEFKIQHICERRGWFFFFSLMWHKQETLVVLHVSIVVFFGPYFCTAVFSPLL